jgi:monoamine oxidase
MHARVNEYWPNDSLGRHFGAVWPQAVAEVESWSDKQTLADVEASLLILYGEWYVQPVDYLVTRWASDPFSYGSYSFVPTNARKVRPPVSFLLPAWCGSSIVIHLAAEIHTYFLDWKSVKIILIIIIAVGGLLLG